MTSYSISHFFTLSQKRQLLIAALVTLSLVLTNCNGTGEKNIEEVEANLPTGVEVYRGDFIYLADAAVLTTQSEIYGVRIDEKMHDLDKAAQEHKKQSTDFVAVVVTAKKFPKDPGTEGWPFILEIQEIVDVAPTDNSGTAIIQSQEEQE